MGKPGWGHAQSPLPEHIGQWEGTGGTETSQYPEEEKATATPRVAASETGYSPNCRSGTACRRCCDGVVGPTRRDGRTSRELSSHRGVEALWKGAPQRVKAPYTNLE